MACRWAGCLLLCLVSQGLGRSAPHTLSLKLLPASVPLPTPGIPVSSWPAHRERPTLCPCLLTWEPSAGQTPGVCGADAQSGHKYHKCSLTASRGAEWPLQNRLFAQHSYQGPLCAGNTPGPPGPRDPGGQKPFLKEPRSSGGAPRKVTSGRGLKELREGWAKPRVKSLQAEHTQDEEEGKRKETGVEGGGCAQGQAAGRWGPTGWSPAPCRAGEALGAGVGRRRLFCLSCCEASRQEGLGLQPAGVTVQFPPSGPGTRRGLRLRGASRLRGGSPAEGPCEESARG